MRKKTDEKRQSIIDAANKLFREHGFEKTSMVEINERAGCSKRTLYSYFPSKEVLFVEAMTDLAEHYMDDIFSCLNKPKDDPRKALTTLGINVLQLICSPRMLASRRLLIAEAERSGIGKLLYENIMGWQQKITNYFALAMQEGVLRQSDPALATAQFRGLIEAEWYEPCLLAVRETPLDKETINAAVERAVSAFLRLYEPEDGQGTLM